MKPEKAEFYMKAFWHRSKASWWKSWAPEGRKGQMEMKCILCFYIDWGYSSERCGPWASCFLILSGTCTLQYHSFIFFLRFDNFAWNCEIGTLLNFRGNIIYASSFLIFVKNFTCDAIHLVHILITYLLTKGWSALWYSCWNQLKFTWKLSDIVHKQVC